MILCYYCSSPIRSPFNVTIFKRKHFHVAHRTCREGRIAERTKPDRHHAALNNGRQENQVADDGRCTGRNDHPITPFLKPSPVEEAKQAAGEAGVDQLTLSLAKLEKLSEAIFPKAAKGDLEAVNLAVMIEKRRAELLGLDARDRQARLQKTHAEKEIQPRQDQNSELKNSSDEDPGRRERSSVSRIPKVR